MPITANEILTEANSRTGRAESSIDTFLKGVLHDLSTRGLSLEAEEEVNLTTDQPNYVFSGFTNKFNRIKQVVIIDSDDDPSDPLTEISWKRYKERLANTLSNGEPTEFCVYPTRGAKTLYLSRKPNAVNYPKMKISGTLRHGDTTTISYLEEYRELLIEGVCWKIESKYNVNGEKARARFELYENEINKLFGDQPTIGLSEYSDI